MMLDITKQRTGKKWVRRIILIFVVMALLPFLLTPLYGLSFVRPISTLMVIDLVTLRGYERQWTPLDDIGPRVVRAVMMSEDGQFCSHQGIDLGEMKAAISQMLSGEQSRGASTITMQTAKNLYLWQSRSFIRKVLEAPLAVYMDLVLTKKQIMEIYLNIAEWGPGIYGAEAASYHYFGRSTRELSRTEAALLAVTLPNPHMRNPARPGAGLRRVANVIERRAQQAGNYISCLK